MLTAYKSMLKNTFRFSGRISVKEYWQAIGMNALLFVAFMGIVAFLGAGLGVFGGGSPIAGVLFFLIVFGLFFLPMISLHIRRLRDTGYPWWLLAAVCLGVPILGAFIACTLKRPAQAPEPEKRQIISIVLLVLGGAMYLWGFVWFLLTHCPLDSMTGWMGTALLVTTAGFLVSRTRKKKETEEET